MSIRESERSFETLSFFAGLSEGAETSVAVDERGSRDSSREVPGGGGRGGVAAGSRAEGGAALQVAGPNRRAGRRYRSGWMEPGRRTGGGGRGGAGSRRGRSPALSSPETGWRAGRR